MAFNRRVTGPMPDPEIMMMPMPTRRFFILRMLRNASIAAGVADRSEPGIQSRFTRVTFHVPPVTLRPGWDGTVLKVPSIVRASRKDP